MRQIRTLLFLCAFAVVTIVTWPGYSGRSGIPYSEWKTSSSVTPYHLASLPIDPASVDLSDLPSATASIPPVTTKDSLKSAAPAPDVAIEDMCVAMAAAAQTADLPVGFLARLIWQESRFEQRVVSPAGAKGVAQFMPATAQWIGLPGPFDPIAAFPASARFLRMLQEQFGNLGLAAAAYNAGPGRIQNWLAGRGKLPDETRNYVRIITGHEPEQWMAPRAINVSFHLPPRAPCEGVAGLSRKANAEKVEVTLEPAIVRLVEAARALAAARAAAAKVAAAKAAQARKLAKKGGSRGKLLARNLANKIATGGKAASGKTAARQMREKGG